MSTGTMYPPPIDVAQRRCMDNNNPYEQTPYDAIQDNVPSQSLSVQAKNPYYCEACNKDCSTRKAFQAHLKSHVTCKYEGCTFSGSQKIVSCHYSREHGIFSGSGFKEVSVAIPGFRPQQFNVCVGNSPDDIENWIKERKMKWPSRANIARKEFEMKRRIEEGGILLSKKITSKRVKVNTSILQKHTIDQKKGKPADGQDSSSLLTLVAGYGSSSDEDNEVNEEIEQNTLKKEEPILSLSHDNEKVRPCRYFMKRGKCTNDNCPYLHDNDMYERAQMEHKEANKRQKAGHRKNEIRNEKSLLRKLLQRDIQRETSLTLQCIRFLVDCNLFRASSCAESFEE